MNFRRVSPSHLVLGLAASVFALSGAYGSDAAADEFPSETINIIIGFAAGGSTDVNTRALANAAEDTCGTSIIIINEPGASGAIALERVRNADPDGYTLGTTPTEISALDHMGLSNVTHRDFSAVMRFIVDPHGMFVNADSPYTTIQELIAAAQDGETFGVATSGPASPYAITFHDFAKAAGVAGQLQNIPYPGDADAIPAALRGEVDLLVTNAANVVSQVESGDLVPLGIAHDSRIDLMPDVPTLAEEGVDVSGGSIYGLAVPADTPSDRVEVLNACFEEAFNTEEFQTFVEKQGNNPDYLNAEDYDAYLAAEYDRYGGLIEALALADE